MLFATFTTRAIIFIFNNNIPLHLYSLFAIPYNVLFHKGISGSFVDIASRYCVIVIQLAFSVQVWRAVAYSLAFHSPAFH